MDDSSAVHHLKGFFSSSRTWPSMSCIRATKIPNREIISFFFSIRKGLNSHMIKKPLLLSIDPELALDSELLLRELSIPWPPAECALVPEAEGEADLADRPCWGVTGAAGSCLTL